MECVLCTIWARMPYANRYTTPTTPEQTQEALVVGYWIARRMLDTQVEPTVPRICERHMNLLTLLEIQEEQRIEAERIAVEAERIAQETGGNIIPRLPEYLQRQVINLQERRKILAERVAQQSVQPIEEFKLGPGPLTNENAITQQPPLPIETDPSAPYRQLVRQPPDISLPSTVATVPLQASVGTIEGALEAAKAPPTEGAKVSYPCPTCGKEITTGDVHACTTD